MKSLSIHEPARMVPRGAFWARLISDDPREGVNAAQYAPSAIGIDIILDAPITISSVFFGYVTGLPADALCFVHAYPEGGPANVQLVGTQPPARSRRGNHCHFSGTFAPVTTREIYFRIIRPGNQDISNANVAIGIGTAFSEVFRAQWGHEWGAGRPLDDTSAVERLPSGSFAIDRGIVTSGYQWTFGDLSDDERERLYDIHRAVGRSRSVLVIEDDERTPGLYERMHWGLLAKLDTYSRVDPTATTWGMQVADWL